MARPDIGLPSYPEILFDISEETIPTIPRGKEIKGKSIPVMIDKMPLIRLIAAGL